jgi:TetR/AcrR family transcriptional regulator, regulator of cefoperazone and chloramphenicol sensitivity
MATQDLDRSQTRASLLAAGADLFAERGYAGARVREIAARAGANVAAVSYHFGGKQGLYLAVLEHEAARMIAQHPLPAADAPQAADVRLRAVIAGLLGRALADDERGYAQRLLVREMLSPSKALPLMVERVQKPQFAQVMHAVRAVVGPALPVDALRLAGLSLVAQCLFYRIARPVIDQVAPGVTDADRREALVDHLLRYNLAALRAWRGGDEGERR